MDSVEVVAAVVVHVAAADLVVVEEEDLAEEDAIVTEEAMEEVEVDLGEAEVTVEEVIAADVEEVGHHLAV